MIDSGLARRPRYDRAAGMTRLVTERASQAAVVQRAGRAARQGPGVAYRLWEEAATAGLPRFDPPEILEADLSALVLACAIWGVADPRALRWLDPPSEAAVSEAKRRLTVLEAIDADGRPTAHGCALTDLPLPPRLAHMLVRSGEMGLAKAAAEVAVLLGERGLGGNDVDLELRLRRWRGERGPRAEGGRRLTERWRTSAPLPARAPGEQRPALFRSGWEPDRPDAGLGVGGPQATPSARHQPTPNPSLSGRGVALAIAIALAFPDRIAKRRDASGETWASAGGRGFRLDPTSSLARAEWLAVAETAGMASGARILSAVEIDRETVAALFADRIVTRRFVEFDAMTGGVTAKRETRLGAIRLASGPDAAADKDEIAAALLEGVRTHGVALLPWSPRATALRTRAAYAGIDALTDAALTARLDDWLPPILAGKRRLDAIEGLTGALEGLLGWEALQSVNRLAPPRFESPAGSTHEIDYAADAGPTVELRPQALFGLAEHPTVGSNRVPLVLSLTSPAGRPIQTTRDLPGFWAGSWHAVAKEMRGRYPRHPWPDDPAAAAATLRTKNADARRKTSG